MRCTLKYWLILVLVLIPHLAHAAYCVPAGDFGAGGVVSVAANPRDNDLELLQKEPIDKQITPWVDAGLFVSDMAVNGQIGLKGYVEGEWYPWGLSSIPGTEVECNLVPCKAGVTQDALCLSNGQRIKGRGQHCKESQGYGLYGLIALSDAGPQVDPNQLDNAMALPTTMFRTFRVGPLKSLSDKTKYFEMDKTQYFDVAPDGSTRLVTDTNASGQPGLKKGRLYFKILDRYYDDNAGSYTITLVNGVYEKHGFVTDTLNMFKSTLETVKKSIYEYLTQKSKLVPMIRATLMLYIMFSSILFMIGMLKMHRGELVVRLFKVGIIGALISTESWEFFNTYFFSLFSDGAQSIADFIIKATVFSNKDPTQPVFLIPDGSSSLGVYDVILKMLTSAPFHQKIWALLFTEKCYFIPVIYICVVFMLLTILKSILIYLLALVNVAMLVIMAPIFITMALFSLTRNMFDDWLKQLISTGMMLIFLAATLALMVKLIMGNIQKILFYKICWESIWKLVVAGTTWVDIKFWNIQNFAQVDASLTFSNLVSFLLVSILFYTFIEKIPEIVDTLSGAARMPTSQLYGGAMQQWSNSRFATGMDKLMSRPSAQIGAQRELLGEAVEKKVRDKFDSMGGPAGAMGGMLGGMLGKAISGLPTAPSTLYRMGQGISSMADPGQDQSPSILDPNDASKGLYKFKDVKKALPKVDLPKAELPKPGDKK